MAVFCTSLKGPDKFNSVLFKAYSESTAWQSLHASFRNNSASLTSKGHQQTNRFGILTRLLQSGSRGTGTTKVLKQ
jgi:hypothetical protein